MGHEQSANAIEEDGWIFALNHEHEELCELRVLFFLLRWMIFPRSRPTMNMALKTDDGADIFGVLDYLHFSKFLTVRRHPI